MVKEFEPIKEAQQDAALATSLLQRKARQRARLEDLMLQSDSIDDVLEANRLIGLIPQKEAVYQTKLDEAKAREQAKIADATAKLDKMAGIPALVERYAAFKAELDSIIAPQDTEAESPAEEIAIPATQAAPATTERTPKYTKGKTYTTSLPNGAEFSTTSQFGKRILETLAQGPVTPQSLKDSVGNGASSLITVMNRQLATQGYRIVNEGPKGQTQYKLIEIETSGADTTSIPAVVLPTEAPSDQSVVEDDAEEPEATTPFDEDITAEPEEEVALAAEPKDELEVETSTEDETTLAAVRTALENEAKRAYIKTGPEELYKRRDLIIYLDEEEILIPNAPGFPATVVSLIQAGIHTRTDIANAIYPEDDPNGRGKISTTINQGVARMLAPYKLTVINLTSQADQKKGVPSNFQIARLPENPLPAAEVNAESLTEESSETLELTDYEAGVVSVLFDDTLIQAELERHGISPLSKESRSQIQDYLPNLAPNKRPQNGDLNTIRVNILTKLGDIYNQGIEGDIFDRSGIGAGILMEYFVGLNADQRKQALDILTVHLRKKLVSMHTASRTGVVDVSTVARQYVDLGPEGRPARPDEAVSRPKRTITDPSSRGSIGLSGVVRSGDLATLASRGGSQTRDLRHRIVQPTVHTGKNTTAAANSAPVYTDAVVAQGPEAIARARAQAVASVDLPREAVEQIEASEVTPAETYPELKKFKADAENAAQAIIETILSEMPELMSNPNGKISPGRLTQIFNNLTHTTLQRYEALKLVKPVLEGGKRYYRLVEVAKAKFYIDFDRELSSNKRVRKQLNLLMETLVDSRIAELSSK